MFIYERMVKLIKLSDCFYYYNSPLSTFAFCYDCLNLDKVRTKSTSFNDIVVLLSFLSDNVSPNANIPAGQTKRL